MAERYLRSSLPKNFTIVDKSICTKAAQVYTQRKDNTRCPQHRDEARALTRALCTKLARHTFTRVHEHYSCITLCVISSAISLSCASDVSIPSSAVRRIAEVINASIRVNYSNNLELEMLNRYIYRTLFGLYLNH